MSTPPQLLSIPNSVTKIEFDYYYNIFYHLISSIRNSKRYFEPIYKHFVQKTKIRTTKIIQKLSRIATIFYLNELQANGAYYNSTVGAQDELVDKSLNYADKKYELY